MLLFKQFRTSGGCESYLIGDAASGRACLIDPLVDLVEDYDEYVATRCLKLEYAVDTHTHADHYSATHLLASRFGARVAMSEKTGSKRATVRLRDDEHLEVAPGLALRVLYTPGHTPDSVSFLLEGSWGAAVFTGDTLLIGASGRTDFPGSDAGAQFDSIHRRLGNLPDTTWVFPAHDYSGLLFSTLGEEKHSNAHWKVTSRADFIQMKKDELVGSCGVLSEIVGFNLDANPSTAPVEGAHMQCAAPVAGSGNQGGQVSVRDYRSVIESTPSDAIFIDVREPEEFEAGHMPGVRNIPLSELVFHWKELQDAASVFVSCQSGGRSHLAAKSLARMGLGNVSNVLGGFSAWVAAGFPVRR